MPSDPQSSTSPLETPSRKTMTPLETDSASVKARLDANDEFLFIDCREPDEYETARIEGAVLIPMSEIQNRINDLEAHREQDIIIHCHHGGRSLHMAIWLRQQGFNQAQSMAGGIDDWSQQIDPSVPRY